MTDDSGLQACQGWLAQINGQVGVLIKRWLATTADVNKLPLYGKNSVSGHQEAFRQAQNALKKALKKFGNGDCEERYDLQLPYGAEAWANWEGQPEPGNWTPPPGTGITVKITPNPPVVAVG
jgi:hypothetical protein